MSDGSYEEDEDEMEEDEENPVLVVVSTQQLYASNGCALFPWVPRRLPPLPPIDPNMEFEFLDNYVSVAAVKMTILNYFCVTFDSFCVMHNNISFLI
jgi:hypothetical protein